MSQGVFVNGNLGPVLGSRQAAGKHISRGTHSISRKITPPPTNGRGAARSPGREGGRAGGVCPTDYKGRAGIGVMASAGNDLGIPVMKLHAGVQEGPPAPLH